MTFDSFIKKYLGKAVDYDSVSSVQCVDSVKLYLDKVFGIKPGAWGNAVNYWTDFEAHPELVRYFDKIKNTPELVFEKGDIIVWSGDISVKNNYGHIAIASGEGDTSTFYSFDQNWNKKELQRVKHTYFAVLGVLRPKDRSSIISVPYVEKGVHSLTNVRGVYKGYGAKSGRKMVRDLTPDGKMNATSSNPKADAYLKAKTKITVFETKLLSTGNLWAKIPSGYICIWERDKDKLFIK